MALLIAIGIIVLAFFFLFNKNRSTWKLPEKEIDQASKAILQNNVQFYKALDEKDKLNFEYQVQEFLLNCRITGIKTNVTDEDRVLIASSAVIPIFHFPDWQYKFLKEVLLYPQSFDEDFNITGQDRNILGMVGTGYMDGKMILSKQALHQGFSNESDKKNTAIHEFVHLIDKQDGAIDGIPEILLNQQYIIPWVDLIEKKINEIRKNDSDINPYGATNQAEFFSVASEYFFERPTLLKRKHPQLYEALSDIFKQQPTLLSIKKARLVTGRNDPCPCQSGLKFKRCCGH